MIDTVVNGLWSLVQGQPYLVLFPLILIEGPLATLAAGALVATGAMSLPLAWLLAITAETAADSALFALGRLGRRGTGTRLLRRLGLDEQRRATLSRSLERNLPGVLLGAKVADAAAIPVILTAGFSGVRFRRFLPWTLALSTTRSIVLLGLGALFGAQLSRYLTPTTSAVLAVTVVAIFLAVAALRRRHQRRHAPPTPPSPPENRRSTAVKILVGTDTYAPDVNGASYFTQRLAAGLHRRGHDVHVMAPARSPRSSTVVRHGVVEHRVRSLPVPGQRGLRAALPGTGRHVRAVLEDVRPDVVHVQGQFGIGRTLVRVAGELGIPVVATNHLVPDNVLHYLPLPDRLGRRVGELLWRDLVRVFDGADVVTAPTPFAAALAETHGVRGPVHPVSCGTDLDRFSPAVDPAPFRAAHHLDGRPTIVFVGRLDAEKHVDELVRALPLVRRRVDAQLVVVGTGHQHGALVALAADLGVGEHVTFAGFVTDEDLPGAYAAADVCVNPGTAELQSIVTLEAMATGRPVVGADALALPLLVREGLNGHLFTPGDVDALAGALVDVLTDDAGRERMGRSSLDLVAAHEVGTTLDAFEGWYAALTASAPDSVAGALTSDETVLDRAATDAAARERAGTDELVASR